jgi:hypothetical protein
MLLRSLRLVFQIMNTLHRPASAATARKKQEENNKQCPLRSQQIPFNQL